MAETGLSAPRVVAVVLAWNSGEDILKCLTLLSASRYPSLEIVVVDNASTDGMLAQIRGSFPAVVLVENEKNLGFAEGNNVGLRYALQQHADYVLLVNDDAFVEQDTIEKLVERAESDPTIGMVGPALVSFYDASKVYYGAELDLGRLAPQEQLMTTPRTDAFETAYIPGCALLVKRATIEKIGLLDPAYFAYWEDTDWCTRAWRAGYRVMLEPKTSVTHRGTLDRTSEKSFFAPYLYRRNQFYFARKFKPFPFWLGYVRRYAFDSLSEVRSASKSGLPRERTDAVLDGWWAGITGHRGDDFAKAPTWFKSFVYPRVELLCTLLYPVGALRAKFPVRTTLRRLLGLHGAGS